MKKLCIEPYYNNHLKVCTDLLPGEIEDIEGVFGVSRDKYEGYFAVMIDKRQSTHIVEESIKNMVFPEREKMGFWDKLWFDIKNGI